MNTDKIYAEQIANEYAPKDTSKVVALRKLDVKAKLPANIFTYTLGVISALVFGTGMCLTMGEIGSGTTGSEGDNKGDTGTSGGNTDSGSNGDNEHITL